MVYWSSLPLQGDSIKMSKYYNPIYAASLKKNLTRTFFKRLRVVVSSKQNLILSAFGPPGSGKSYAMIFIAERQAKFAGKRLDIKNWVFTVSKLLDVIEKLSEGEEFGLDEQVHTAGYGSRIERAVLDNVEMTVRAHKLSFYFLSPKHIPHNYHYFLEVWQMGADKMWDWSKPIEEQWKYTKLVVFDHKSQMLGYIITGTPGDNDFLVKYEKKKDKFIKEIRKRRGSGRHKHILDRAYKLVEQEKFFRRFILCKTKRLKRLLTVVALKGELMSIEELNMLLDYVDYIINFEPELRRKRDKFLSEIKSQTPTEKFIKRVRK